MMMMLVIHLWFIQLTAARILHNSQEMKHNVLKNAELGARDKLLASRQRQRDNVMELQGQEKFK